MEDEDVEEVEFIRRVLDNEISNGKINLFCKLEKTIEKQKKHLIKSQFSLLQKQPLFTICSDWISLSGWDIQCTIWFSIWQTTRKWGMHCGLRTKYQVSYEKKVAVNDSNSNALRTNSDDGSINPDDHEVFSVGDGDAQTVTDKGVDAANIFFCDAKMEEMTFELATEAGKMAQTAEVDPDSKYYPSEFVGQMLVPIRAIPLYVLKLSTVTTLESISSTLATP
ncbi:hypothetical protein L484_027962 [Morus notabilis]|uniref:Uncharacterized protein n=1 Tax=Morus notabilis TaxID=981085 RepID=W9S7M3_9ROSA|nr:hypothetical protein L484_027962 [Morus notabilis]